VKLLMMLISVIMINCSATKEVSWTVENDYAIIQLEEVNPYVENYYAEITLESGSKIAIELGKPDENKKFRVKYNFGKFRKVEIYTNLDL
jgi:hypothetical protein